MPSSRGVALVVAAAAILVACVDGKTPDCTEVDSGCFPTDSGTSPPLDAAPDAAPDANASDASDAATALDAPAG